MRRRESVIWRNEEAAIEGKRQKSGGENGNLIVGGEKRREIGDDAHSCAPLSRYAPHRYATTPHCCCTLAHTSLLHHFEASINNMALAKTKMVKAA
jgi:hypothetical protein